jgi:hypothetical protein
LRDSVSGNNYFIEFSKVASTLLNLAALGFNNIYAEAIPE